MIFSDENKLEALSDDELRTLEAATHTCDDTLRESGQVATTVRVRNGRVSVTDGPFAETNG